MALTRRSFFTQTPALALTLGAATSPAERPGPRKAEQTSKLQLAGMSLEQLGQLYRRELDQELAFWERHGVDRDHGGFICALDHDGTVVSTEKNVTYQGRGLWVYSFLYNELGRDPRHLEVARRTKDLLFTHARRKGSVWPEMLDRDGVTRRRFRGSVYDGLYVSLGLQEYYRAAKDAEAMEESVRTLLRCLEIYDRPEFGGEAPGRERPPTGARSQGVEMVAVDLLTQLLDHNSDSRLEQYQDRIVEALLEKFFHPEFRLNNEYLKHDYSRFAEAPWRDHSELGYSIASFWSLLREALRRRDFALFRLVSERLRRHLEVAWDDIYGGLGMSARVESGCFDYRKVAYVHGEAMIALLLVIEHLGTKWAQEWYDRIHSFAFAKFPLQNHTGWHAYMDRRCTPQAHTRRRENFHYPRFLMMNWLTLARLEKQRAATS